MEGYKIDGANLQRLRASFDDVKNDVLLNAISDPSKLKKMYDCFEQAIYEMGTMYGKGYAKGIEDAAQLKNEFALEWIPRMQEQKEELLKEGFVDNWGDAAFCKNGIVVGLLKREQHQIGGEITEYKLLTTNRIVSIMYKKNYGSCSA